MTWNVGDKRRVNGVLVEMIGPSQWMWVLTGGCRWHFGLFGHKLHCEGELVAEGCGSLGRAVTLSQGYEMGVADMIRKANRDAREASARKKRAMGIIEFPALEGESKT